MQTAYIIASSNKSLWMKPVVLSRFVFCSNRPIKMFDILIRFQSKRVLFLPSPMILTTRMRSSKTSDWSKEIFLPPIAIFLVETDCVFTCLLANERDPEIYLLTKLPTWILNLKFKLKSLNSIVSISLRQFQIYVGPMQ